MSPYPPFSQNSRLQTTAITAANAASYTMMDRTYSYDPAQGLSGSCAATSGSHDTGNIWKIADNLNSNWTKQFQYDCMDRLTSAKIGSATTDYWLDSFGNMSPKVSGSPVNTFSSSTNRISNLPCASYYTPFDAAGNQMCDSDPSGAARGYAYDANEQPVSITMNGAGTPFVSYLNDSDQMRARKDNADGAWTEYFNFNGQPVAEKDNTSSWTDYIYAGDKKIARTTTNDTTIHIQGTMCSTCVSNYAVYFATWINGYVIRSGDSLHVRQYQNTTACGGPDLTFTDGTRLGYSVYDQHGYLINEDGVHNAWSQRDFDLSAYAGKTVSDFLLLAEGCTLPGTYDQWYGDMSVVSADGSVENLWNGQSSVSLAAWSPDPGVTGATYDVSTTGTPTGTSAQSLANRTHYYLDDHLGTAQYELSSSGWPLWQGQFDAYGKELADPAGTVFHYKFTGKERDAESGLDYFGARYYGSGMGRWMSADWADKPEAVPYSILTDPQSLNLYSYVRNHPISAVDADGHADNGKKQAFGCLGEMTDTGDADGGSNCQAMTSAQGNAADSNLEFNQQQYQDMLARNRAQQQASAADESEGIVSRVLNNPIVENGLEKVATFSSGAADFMTFGITKKINEADGGAAFINYSSGTYTAGKATGIGIGLVETGAGILRGLTSAAIREGAPAIAAGETPAGGFFGRAVGGSRPGLLNRGPLRFGYSWQGTAKNGKNIIRLGIGAARGTNWWSHIVTWREP